jgi:hypothetical protein
VRYGWSCDVNKYLSECIRKGEPASHRDACFQVMKIVDSIKFLISQKDEVLSFPDGFTQQFDVTVRDIRLAFEGKDPIVMIVEPGDFGDDSRHSKKSQILKDNIRKQHVYDYMPGCQYYKINKFDCAFPDYVKKYLKLTDYK